MAITHNGTVNSLPATQLPASYTKPTVTTFTDHQYISDLTLEVLKATVEDADPAVTMANILTNGTIGLNKQIEDILAADYLASATVTSYAVLSVLRTNYSDMAKTGDFLTTTAAKYICTVKLYVKAL